MHLRPPSTSPSDERMYEEDLEWYKYFDEIGKKITGYQRAGDVYQDYGEEIPSSVTVRISVTGTMVQYGTAMSSGTGPGSKIMMTMGILMKLIC